MKREGKIIMWIGAIAMFFIMATIGAALYVVNDLMNQLGKQRIAPAAKSRWPKKDEKDTQQLIDEKLDEINALQKSYPNQTDNPDENKS